MPEFTFLLIVTKPYVHTFYSREERRQLWPASVKDSSLSVRFSHWFAPLFSYLQTLTTDLQSLYKVLLSDWEPGGRKREDGPTEKKDLWEERRLAMEGRRRGAISSPKEHLF